MGSPHTDVLMLNGVAALVRDLAEFAPVHELFQTHLKRWRKKNALIAAQRRKAKAQLATFWREEPKAANSDEYEHRPARMIFSPDHTKWKVVQIPLQLNRKLERYDHPRQFQFLRSLDTKQDSSPTESFVLLAELHDAAFSKRQLGYAEDYIVDVAEATKILKDGISQVAVERLATLFEKSLDRIESQADSNAKNRLGDTLQQIIQRSRKKLEDLVTISRQHFVTHTNQESVLQEVLKLRSDVKASLLIPGPPAKRKVSTRTPSRRKKPRGSIAKSDTLIQKVLDSGNSETIKKWVFANEDDLAELCGCSRGTVMKTEFWKQNRASQQAKWNRKNGGRQPKMKSET